MFATLVQDFESWSIPIRTSTLFHFQFARFSVLFWCGWLERNRSGVEIESFRSRIPYVPTLVQDMSLSVVFSCMVLHFFRIFLCLRFQRLGSIFPIIWCSIFPAFFRACVSNVWACQH